MKRTLLTLTIIIVGLFYSKSYAQSYVPNPGEVIIFYPVSDIYKEKLGGYDCFYNTSDVYKNEKTIVKPKYRFKQKDGLTPFEEIEGHSFTVITSLIENKNAHKSEKKIYLLFLQRDDGEKVLLRIPFVHRKEDNILTNSMSLQSRFLNLYNENNINIPCCIQRELFSIKKYIGKDVVHHYSSNRKKEDEGKAIFLLKTNMKEIQKSYVDDLFSANYHIYHCEDVMFININNHIFKQPVVLLKYNDMKIYVPAFDFRAYGSSLYGIQYSFNEQFEYKDKIFEKRYSKINDSVKALVGKYIVYYRYGNDVEQYLYERINNIGNNEKYIFKKDERYYIEKIDFSQIDNTCYYMYAILKDDYNNKIQMPVKYLETDNSGYLGGLFVLEDSVLARKKRYELETAKKDSIDIIYYKSIKKKYGNSYAAFYMELSYFQKETFRKAAAKWGPSVAKDISEGYVRIGWNKEKCLMSWGKPKDINKSIGSWGVHEQWCYSSGYLYFENGKLTSIQD